MLSRASALQRDDDPPQGVAPILNLQAIFDRLEEEIFRAERYSRPLAVLCIVPQRVVGEVPQPGEIASAADFVGSKLRFSDRVGVLTDGSILAILPETPLEVARRRPQNGYRSRRAERCGYAPQLARWDKHVSGGWRRSARDRAGRVRPSSTLAAA